jgi:hypothetical protein
MILDTVTNALYLIVSRSPAANSVIEAVRLSQRAAVRTRAEDLCRYEETKTETHSYRAVFHLRAREFSRLFHERRQAREDGGAGRWGLEGNKRSRSSRPRCRGTSTKRTA